MDRTSSKSRRWTALLARASGMVSATAVDGYRRAGGAVYEDLSAAEAVRAELAAAGTDLWSLRDGPSSQLLATWCAFALQSLGEQLVQFEYAASPRTVGYLSAMTAEQATVFFEAAGKWSARARRAAVDPAYDLADDVRLPAPLPTWRRMGPCPPTHVQAMLAAAGALRDRAQVALGDFLAVPLPADGAAGTPERLEGLYAQADAAVGQAEQMWRPSDYQPLHRAVEDTARDALEQLFRLGQILARPSLLAVGGTGNGPGVHPTPDAPDFDPWCISDPVATGNEHDDPAARSALEHLWRNDPDPAATIALFEAVEHEAANGSVVHEPEAGYYYCTPWPSIYTVVRPVTLAGHALTPGQQFTLDICTGDHAGGDSSFRRDLLIQSFSPTSRLGYCDQEASGPRGSC